MTSSFDDLPDEQPPAAQAPSAEDLFLKALGDRVRTLRARRGMTRKFIATGNASILVLRQVAQALQCPLAELVGDVSTSSPEWLLIRELLENKSEAQLRLARLKLAELYSGPVRADKGRSCRIALIGLRGAGKTTLGQMLADDLGFPFVELSREIEQFAGCSIAEIHNLYGANAYRRYERRALEETIQIYPEFVMATPGGIVSDAGGFNLMLDHCFTVWLQARPEDHMGRVARQGDMRPMAASPEAMEDLKRILEGRSAFYSKADLVFNTSDYVLEDALQELKKNLQKAQALPA